jgi:hypothetical protein
MRLLLVLALFAVIAASPASALAPGPWRQFAQGAEKGQNFTLLVTAHLPGKGTVSVKVYAY